MVKAVYIILMYDRSFISGKLKYKHGRPMNKKEKAYIDPGLSVYFDLIRFFAAIIVVMNHYGVLLSLAKSTTFPGSDAVIVFFVLSGYVINYVSDRSDLTGYRYIFYRLSRLWSVAVPATLLSIILGSFCHLKVQISILFI